MENNFLKSLLDSVNINVDSEKINKLEMLKKLTLKSNALFNLTSITDELEFDEKMILDSLMVSLFLNLDNKKIIDVGTGAGFPGLALAILFSSSSFSLLDSTNKKIQHINNVCEEIGVTNVNTVCDRAENFCRLHRESFDVCVARAVSRLDILVEICAPLVKINGFFVALKGPSYLKEIEESKSAIKKLGLSMPEIKTVALPISKEVRAILIFKKINKSNNKYPRDYSLIKSKPI